MARGREGRLHGRTEYARQQSLLRRETGPAHVFFVIFRGAKRSNYLNQVSVRRFFQLSSKTTGATGLAGRYAAALIDLAEAENLLDQAAEDLGSLGDLIGESEDLRRLIRSPVISRDDQNRAIGAIMEQAEICDLIRRFVGVVTQNRRLFALPDMILAYVSILAKRRGEATAEVISAKELTEKQFTAIGDSLKKAIGNKISIDAKVDPDLLGGLVVKVGSRMVDSSLRTKLQQLRLAMKGVG